MAACIWMWQERSVSVSCRNLTSSVLLFSSFVTSLKADGIEKTEANGNIARQVQNLNKNVTKIGHKCANRHEILTKAALTFLQPRVQNAFNSVVLFVEARYKCVESSYHSSGCDSPECMSDTGRHWSILGCCSPCRSWKQVQTYPHWTTLWQRYWGGACHSRPWHGHRIESLRSCIAPCSMTHPEEMWNSDIRQQKIK